MAPGIVEDRVHFCLYSARVPRKGVVPLNPYLVVLLKQRRNMLLSLLNHGFAVLINLDINDPGFYG
jgi:hypothetical protein